MKTKPILLSLALLTVSVLSISCTDHLDVQGLPASCKDTKGKDVNARVEMRIFQQSDRKTAGTVIVSTKGDADFKIGASTQSQSLLRSGHRPENPDVNAIYTADPVLIELRFKDPCKVETKKLTVVLDDLPHKQMPGGRVRYEVKFDQFKP
ncbi:MAG TPA: hypothetical protein VKF81_07920 [Blastocatellia bacterium]|nr:hypothetical protein [Blastocatellia bacterium]